MFVIERNSPAWQELTEILADPATRKVSIEDRGDDGVAIKCNEHMWSPTLKTT